MTEALATDAIEELDELVTPNGAFLAKLVATGIAFYHFFRG
jgi:hypothetical protein